MPLLKNANLRGFDSPTQLPQTADEARAWQEANRSWWESHPMRYDWDQEIPTEEFGKEFYEEIDRRFFADAETYLPSRRIPFDALIDYQNLHTQDVLEIGVGNGSHAGLLAQHARSFTGIDLTSYAVTSTTRRFQLFGLPGTIRQMDAEHMDFPDGSFDFIWSWGVIHHSSNTRQILGEMNRVLRPGGHAVVMVYHRNFWTWYVAHGITRGVIRGQILKTHSLHQIVQRGTDGALARYYRIPEFTALASEFFQANQVGIYGSKEEIVPLPGGKAKRMLSSAIPNRTAHFLTHRFRMGGFLVAFLQKPGAESAESKLTE